jgi:hypothetical protein
MTDNINAAAATEADIGCRNLSGENDSSMAQGQHVTPAEPNMPQSSIAITIQSRKRKAADNSYDNNTSSLASSNTDTCDNVEQRIAIRKCNVSKIVCREKIVSFLLSTLEGYSLMSLFDAVRGSIVDTKETLYLVCFMTHMACGLKNEDFTYNGNNSTDNNGTYSLSYKYRVTIALENLSNANPGGSSAEEIISEVKSQVTYGEVSPIKILAALSDECTFICNNSIYSVRSDISPDEWNGLLAMVQSITSSIEDFTAMYDQSIDNDSDSRSNGSSIDDGSSSIESDDDDDSIESEMKLNKHMPIAGCSMGGKSCQTCRF